MPHAGKDTDRLAHVALFSSAFDTSRNCDAYLVDSERAGRAITVRTDAPGASVVDEVVGRAVLMSRNLHRTEGEEIFALFAGAGSERFTLAVSDPVSVPAYSMLRDALGSFGSIEEETDVRLDEVDLAPLLAYENGRVSFFDWAGTRDWRDVAGRRGLRMLSCTPSHDPDPDVEVR